MKKSELKQRILELEVERDNANSYKEMWEESVGVIFKTLKEHKVKIDVKMPEAPKIDYTTRFDTERKYISGIVSGVPVITLDFTEHDMEVLRNRG